MTPSLKSHLTVLTNSPPSRVEYTITNWPCSGSESEVLLDGISERDGYISNRPDIVRHE